MEHRYFSPEVETASRERIREIQSENLREMIAHAYNDVPFYKKKMDEMGISPDDIKSIDDISKLPFTTKQDMRDTYPYGLFGVKREELARIHASSGTTGKQTVVGYTLRDLDDWDTAVARALTSIGTTEKDFVHVSYGYGLFTGGLGIHGGAQKMGATVIPVSTGNTQRQIKIFCDFGSNILSCTPSYALYLGETMQEMGVKLSDISLRAGFFGAEPWTEEMRVEIEKSLGIKACDIYGLSEITGPGVAFECIEQRGMHINEDMYYPEIIDPDTGEQLPLGQEGELVFTCIRKQALPLIRYRTRDIASLFIDDCPCGRHLIKMTKPRGRTDDMLIIRGINVFPSQVESVLLDLGLSAPHYMLVVDRVDNLDTLEVQVEVKPEIFSDSIRKVEEVERKIKSALSSILNISASVKLVEPKSIPRSEGKAVHVIDKRKLI